MSDLQTDELVIDAMANEFNISADKLDSEVHLTEDIGLDSIDRLGLAVCLEKRFGIRVGNKSIHRVKTIGDVIELVAVGQA